jgi:hypothetical protein
MINRGKGMLITGGLIMKKKKKIMSMSGKKGQWCPPGLRRSQKRRVQRLRNQELKHGNQEETSVAPKRQAW